MKKLALGLTLISIMFFGLIGCGNNNEAAGPGTYGALAVSPLAALDNILAQFPEYVQTTGSHVEGTTLHFGIISTAALPGLFGGAVFSTAAVDTHVTQFIGTSASILSTTEDYVWGQEGIATFTYDLSNNTITFTLQEEVFWHDGVQLTLADLAFAYYVIAHPDYIGLRFSTYERMIVGIMDYHNGYVDYIAGVTLSDDNMTLTLEFTQMSPAMMAVGVWTSPMPKHIFETMEVADMLNSDAVRINPIGWGPFIVENIVLGESVHLVRNENFVWGVPYIEEVVIQRVESSLVPAAMQTGQFDITSGFPAIYFEHHQNPTNFSYLGTINSNYNFIAFRLGTFNSETGMNEFNDHRTMANVALRQALAHAINHNELGQQVFHGLSFAAGSFMPPIHRGLMDLSLPHFPYDPDYARSILDEAGFIDIDGDGFRECPDGNPLVLNWARGSDPATEEIVVPFYIQSWADIGINVQLWQGRTHDQNYLWDVIDFDTDNEEIHIYTRQWTAGFNPHPGGRWGHTLMNAARYTSETFDSLLDNLSSPEAFDRDVMRDLYFQFQAYVQAQAPFVPTRWSISITPVNNRVAGYDLRPGISPRVSGWHTVRLTAATSYTQ